MYSRVCNKHSTTFINFCNFFSGATVLLKGTYAYLRGVRLFFWPDFFQGVRLFKGVRLFQTIEYVPRLFQGQFLRN